MGRSRKPLWVQAHRGFKSHSLRQMSPPRHVTVRMHARVGEAEPGKDHFDRAVLARALRFAKPYTRPLILSVLCIFGASIIALAPPLVFRHIIDDAIPSGDLGLVNWLFLLAVVLAVTDTALNVANRWLSATIGEGLIYDLRVALYDHVQQMPIAFFTRTRTGSLLSRLSNDVVGAQATVTTSTGLISNVLTLATTFIAMLALSPQVTLLALGVVPLFIALDRWVGRRLVRLSRRRMDANAEMTTTMQERFNVSGALLVKLFGRHADEIRRFSRDAVEVRDSGIAQALVNRMYYASLALTASLGTALVYWLGGRSVIDHGLTIGTLTALAAYVTRLYDPLTSIASARVDLLTALVSFDRCFEVLDTPNGAADAPNARPLVNPKGDVRLDQVWFRYPPSSASSIASLEEDVPHDAPSDWILRNVSLHAAPGETLALVGHSGAGKTTLTMLLSRLYDADQGTVELDGSDVKELTRQSITDAIGVVSQDVHLFHDSIASNLRYASPNATDAELIDACKRARIHDVIEAMPDRYNTLVGERGYRLSGGEKQRLAIARVLLKRPAIVVLDEATAHLDSTTEHLVQQALNEALTGRTAIVIAHRLSTVRNATTIAVLRAGEVVETGTHSELLAKGGLYADLYETQFKE